MAITNFDTVVAGLGGSRRLDQNQRYSYDSFPSRPLFVDQDGDGIPTGNAGDENILLTADNGFEYHILGTQTIVFPGWGADGLEIGAMDQTADDGMELSQGITARSKAAFVVGTDAFFGRVTFQMDDISGSDDLAFGFRLVEANQANLDDYRDFAVLNSIAGLINIETDIDASGTTTTDTTDLVTVATDITFEVRVTAAGLVSYLIDGAAPTTLPAAAFSFTSADVVMPFLFFLQDTDITTLDLKLWENGLIGSRGLDGVGDLLN